jgi:hypothetical protein
MRATVSGARCVNFDADPPSGCCKKFTGVRPARAGVPGPRRDRGLWHKWGGFAANAARCSAGFRELHAAPSAGPRAFARKACERVRSRARRPEFAMTNLKRPWLLGLRKTAPEPPLSSPSISAAAATANASTKQLQASARAPADAGTRGRGRAPPRRSSGSSSRATRGYLFGECAYAQGSPVGRSGPG